ncbi:ATP-binding protein [Chlorobaculum thiosulfatiphilum]|uniref:ATP-binding protein n=1 Tax=Chlorobaculum thiosulfatiphilum TaxID=115852 RepID=A0A5C4S7R4_CHLTI|nr:ATP-binding protein [Chlorobaculum thiosulfatiphilum]TNJ39345.1 ATP-binding protein [Chlorobaculum thiosulfatiphilum]
MSIAGIRSNRGDIYQTLIAFDWALTVLSDPEYKWLEIDSTAFPVDDVVIGKSDGSLICCQCKKNQPDFRAWSISDLGDELDKASVVLAENQQAQVKFYSRGEFGALAKLREYSTLWGNDEEYLGNLTQEHIVTNRDLDARITVKAPRFTTYEFLCRTSFETSPDFDRIETLQRERLRYLTSNSDAAFNALWVRIDNLGGRISSGNLSASAQHRLTKDDLKDILHQAGAMLVPMMSITEVRESFASTSTIGRSWQRDIAGHRISSPLEKELLSAIDAKKHAVLLTGLPGSGKTCVMLNLQEALEQRMELQSDLVPLFIQSREFADFATAQERQAQGLSEQWVEQVARLAENTYVVVVIDSLDVLSIAREHSVLTYFLAQIDQLLLIPNVTVITSCRDFDRKYDRRIATRQWDCELQRLPLNWDSVIVPLLDSLGIDTSAIDDVTRKLIQNPRELALFVELAQREGIFNVVTSQALAQRYLDAIVQIDHELGDEAMQVLENMANAMLKSRSLSIPYQRLKASPEILRRLHSLNVLQDTHDGKLTFGHQTLLDVLVISSAIRQGVSLNEFIKGLPPVPFVRPSIRSFVAQLATGDRREFRKQLRAVLTGNAAFHIRRLIAESFAQQVPQDDDWLMIRDLRDKHREVFQVIYIHAELIEWHYFWLSHLVPILKEMHDSEGMTAHVYQVVHWQNEDTARIMAFWMEALDLDWLDRNRIAEQLVFGISKLKTEKLPLVTPLLERLLSVPKPAHSILGKTIARGVETGAFDDRLLWCYIAGDVDDDDVIEFHFNNKLHCQPHEFGDKNDGFFVRRMVNSVVLLDVALESIERWSQIKLAKRVYRCDFLDETSYFDVHSQIDHRHVDGERILFDAIEVAILDHAKNHSEWWLQNRERLSFNHEAALRYFAIIAYTKHPQQNIDLIGRMLCDRDLLESKLSYELCELSHTAFILLDRDTQHLVLTTMQGVFEEYTPDRDKHSWILKNRAGYISSVPCFLRTIDAQAILDEYERKYGKMDRKPSIGMTSSSIAAPFSFERFLSVRDEGVIRLLSHYSGYNRDFEDFSVGREREVGWQLREAASRHPVRFLRLLVSQWTTISARFRDDIMAGITTYLAYCFGNLQINGNWEPIDEPDAADLVSHILDELERHSDHWQLNRSAAEALESCAHVICDTQSAMRLVFLAIGFERFKDEESVFQGDSVSLINVGYGMISGKVVEALMILIDKLYEQGIELPELLPPLLLRFASNENPAIRALILRRLPYLQSKNPELGWELFRLAMQKNYVGLWRIAEPCLYYAYYDHFEKVAPLLERIFHEGGKDDMETWGRISALSAFRGHIDFSNLLDDLKTLNITEAWKGAADVWTSPGNIKLHRDQCLVGIEAGLNAASIHSKVVAQCVEKIYREKTPPIAIPDELVRLFFVVLENDSEDKYHSLFGFDEWLNTTSQRDPEFALNVTEIYLAYVSRAKPYFYDYDNQLVQLVTRLFAEAEEREESDNGEMLKRVVKVQDLLLALGVTSVNDWLIAAERQ